MEFRENLLKRITINDLVKTVDATIGTAQSGAKVDKKSMKKLLDMSTFDFHKDRDMDLYTRSIDDKNQQIVVLDNELPLFETTFEDVLLRRNPTVKEMINIRNAIKILNDKDVVKFRRNQTLDFIQKDLLKDLDLTFSPKDIESMLKDSVKALSNEDTEAVIESICLFAEILGYVAAPPLFQIKQHKVWGKSIKDKSGKTLFGPMVIYGQDLNRLVLWSKSFESLDPGMVQTLFEERKVKISLEIEGAEVFKSLMDKALAQGVVAPV